MESRYPWYETICGDGLEQGDLLRSFPILVAADAVAPEANEVRGELRTLDAIILTQSCDLESDKVCSVLLCPIHDLWLFVEGAKKRNENWAVRFARNFDKAISLVIIS